VARVGGDEFMVLLPETDRVGGQRFVARVRSALRLAADGEDPTVVLSIAAASARADEVLAVTVDRADAAMYAAKKRRATREATGQTGP
jgi:diguanylate cyclase (GGDEF)-like protein